MAEHKAPPLLALGWKRPVPRSTWADTPDPPPRRRRRLALAPASSSSSGGSGRSSRSPSVVSWSSAGQTEEDEADEWAQDWDRYVAPPPPPTTPWRPPGSPASTSTTTTAASRGSAGDGPARTWALHEYGIQLQVAQALRKRLAVHGEWHHRAPGRSWATLARRTARHLHRRHRQHTRRQRLVTRERYSTHPTRGLVRAHGDERMHAIEAGLDQLGYTRSSAQKLFHFWFLQAVLPLVYADNWDAAEMRVLKARGLTEVRQEVLVITARRMGKTMAVAMLVVMLLLHVPGLTLAIFSTGQRASTSLTRIIMGMMEAVPGAMSRICKYGQEELFLCAEPLPPGQGHRSGVAQQRQSLPSTSKLFSYPGSAKGNRGYAGAGCRVRGGGGGGSNHFNGLWRVAGHVRRHR